MTADTPLDPVGSAATQQEASMFARIREWFLAARLWEPAVVRSIIVGGLTVGTLAGLNTAGIDEQQVDAATTAVVSLASIIGVIWIRAGVVPVKKASEAEARTYELAYQAGLYTPVPELLDDNTGRDPEVEPVYSVAEELEGIGEA